MRAILAARLSRWKERYSNLRQVGQPHEQRAHRSVGLECASSQSPDGWRVAVPLRRALPRPLVCTVGSDPEGNEEGQRGQARVRGCVGSLASLYLQILRPGRTEKSTPCQRFRQDWLHIAGVARTQET